VAITIENEPGDITPVYSDITYTLSSTNSGQTNFKFVAVVKNAAGTILAKLKAPVYTGTNYGVFNLSRILQNYVTFDFNQATTIPAKCTNSFLAYSVEFGEEYGGSEYLNLTSDTGKYCWNGLFSKWESEAVSDYEIAIPSSRKFLTTVRSRRVTRAQYDYLYFLRGAATGVDEVEVKAYNAAGVATTSVIDQTFNTTAKDEYLLRMAAGVVNLNQISAASLISGTAGSVVPVGTVYYTIQLKQSIGNDPCSEAYRFDVIEECSKYTPRVLYFLNRLGGFETLRCSMLNRDTFEVQRKQLKRNTYEFTGTVYGRDTSAHGIANYSTTKTRKVILNTDFLNATEWQWVDDLLSSPIVYLDGTIPVNITNTSMEVFDLNDGPQQLRIEVEYTEPEILQNI
jgi:hypothetical protein